MLSVVVALATALLSGQAQAPAASTARISGRVLAEGANTPIAGARVVLILNRRAPGPPFEMPPQTTTDQDGRFVFGNVAPGSYRIQAEKPGFAQAVDFGTMRAIELAAGQVVDTVDIALPKGGAIAGTLLDPSGAPLAEARIMVMRRIESRGPAPGPRLVPAPSQGQQTNDLGEFRVYGLAPGTYYVAAMPRPVSPLDALSATAPAAAGRAATTIATTYYPGTTDQAAAQPVTVAAGDTVPNISFTMQSAPAFRVSGIVVDDSGNAVPGAMVVLTGDPRSGMVMGPAGSARSQDDGRFVIDGVTPGSYRAMASIPIVSTGSGGGFTSWSSSSSSGAISGGVAGGVSGGIVISTDGPGGIVNGGNPQMAPPVEIAVTDADVKGLRIVVRR